MNFLIFLCRGSEAADGDSVKSHSHRLPSLRLANGRIRYGTPPDDENPSEGNNRGGSNHSSQGPPGQQGGPIHRQDSIKISVDNTNTGTDSLVTANDEDLVNDYISPEMNFKDGKPTSQNPKGGSGGDNQGERDDVSLYGTPKEEIGPGISEAKAGFMRNQLEALFQPSDNKLAMKLFGSKKALMKERIRQKAAGHWIIHPCSKFR
ncbi:ion_trans_N domain-containing protein [Caerostris darwini]|uniref:Ion_trans_N domain-containing protein n=1 Tax=Caerostris darwini TaxID=1538125 RepID=A0AAV4P8Y6_9ARAC|nr:ion_trans_N domain-containing protein [Caerostris darwini]